MSNTRSPRCYYCTYHALFHCNGVCSPPAERELRLPIKFAPESNDVIFRRCGNRKPYLYRSTKRRKEERNEKTPSVGTVRGLMLYLRDNSNLILSYIQNQYLWSRNHKSFQGICL